MRLLLAVLILASACSEPGEQRAPMPPTEHILAPLLDPAKGVLLPPDKAETLTRQCSRKSPGPLTGTWTPTPGAIADLEARLGAELEKQIAATPNTGASPQDYYRQYAGLLLAGKQVIYINGIAAGAVERETGERWKTEPIMICDGGSITFGVEYDPATKSFENFAFNGQI